MSKSSQLRLLLWKDYLVRKRKPITVGGIIWACMTILSLVIVRNNVDPDIIPTCQFKARALPSVGILPFLQSFICTINNDCESFDQYEAIPKYENSRLQKYQKQFQPVFQNESIIEAIEILPNSAKLLATVTNLIDDPEIHHIFRDGLKISEIFKQPQHTKELLGQNLFVESSIFDACFNSSIKIQNAVNFINYKTNITCVETFTQLLNVDYHEKLPKCFEIICNMNTNQIKNITTIILHDINTELYSKLIGDFFNKLLKTEAFSDLINMFNSFMRLTDFWHFLPNELQTIITTYNSILNRKDYTGDGFSYIHIDLVHHIANIFEELFSETEIFQNIKNFINTSFSGLGSLEKILHKFLEKYIESPENDFERSSTTPYIDIASKRFIYFTDSLGSILIKKNKINEDSITALVKFAELILKLFPQNTVDEAAYYLTLVNHLVDGAYNTLKINLHMEDVIYNITLNHPEVIQHIKHLGPAMVGKIIDGLADPNKIQIFTKKIFHPEQFFCNVNYLQKFLSISKNNAEDLKPILCNEVWNNYSLDVIDGFGVNHISNTINKGASLIIAKTLGKNVDEKLISTTKTLYNIFNFIKFLLNEMMNPEKNNTPSWENIFDNSTYDSLSKLISSRKKISKVALVTIHSALAKEVIATNSILQLYITPPLVRLMSVMKALLNQLQTIPKPLLKEMEKNIPKLLEVLLATLNDEKRILKVLTVDHETLFCGMVENCDRNESKCEKMLGENDYVVFPRMNESLHLAKLFCQLSSEISKKLDSKLEDDLFLKAIKHIIKNPDFGKDSKIDWNDFIITMQKVYILMDDTFGFLFIPTDKRNDEWKNVNALIEQISTGNTFLKNGEKAGKLGINFVFYVFQILDRKIFQLDEFKVWSDIKHMLDSFNSILYTIDNVINFFKALAMEKEFVAEDFPLTSIYLSQITTNLAAFLKSTAMFLASKSSNMDPFINILNNDWPCSNMSLAEPMLFNYNATKFMKSVETLLCANYSFYSEWTNEKHFNKIISLAKTNSTASGNITNVFWNTASNINSFATDLKELFDIIKTLEGNTDSDNNLRASWKFASDTFSQSNINHSSLIIMFRNIDTLMNSINEPYIEINDTTLSVGKLWENAVNCQVNDSTSLEYCKRRYWIGIKYTTKYIAEGGLQIVNDLMEYFNETTEQGANILQLIGFTKKTGPYIIYDKLPDFIEVLLNSYIDQGFMKQLYRSLGKQFWDCERLLDKLAIPVSSRITENDIKIIKPYICPSLVHWVSIPINENVLLDLIAKPQYIFFATPVSNFTATMEIFFKRTLEVKDKAMNLTGNSNKSYSLITDEWLKKFTTFPLGGSKSFFNSYYFHSGMNMVYLTEVTKALNDILKKAISIQNSTEYNQEDLKIFIKLLSKRPTEMIDLFVFATTESIRAEGSFENFSLIESLNNVCQNTTKLTAENLWIKINIRMSKQFCKTNYEDYIELTGRSNQITTNWSKDILRNFFQAIAQVSEHHELKTLFFNYSSDKIQSEIFNNMIIGFNSTDAGYLIKKTSKYAHELGLQHFLAYLEMQLSHFDIVLSFASGKNWWKEIRQLYNSTFTNPVFDVVENSIEITYDVLSNIHNLKLIKLIKEIKLNNTNILCELQLSEYIPDKTNYLKKLKDSLCHFNKTTLYTEITPLKFAVQVYDDKFFIKDTVNDTNLVKKIDDIKQKISHFHVNKPMEPMWLNQNLKNDIKLFDFGNSSVRINFAFFLLNNIVDASTLFRNSSASPISSNLTPLIKQINLQFIKRDEYTELLCNLYHMNSDNINSSLTEEFHWDLALSEIYTGRNYTWIEMNKSFNVLFEHVRYYLQDTSNTNKERVTKCLVNVSGKDYIDSVAFHLKLGSSILKLIKTYIPHLKTVNGFKNESNIHYLFRNMKNNIPLPIELNKILLDTKEFKKDIVNLFDGHFSINESNIVVDLNKLIKYNQSMDVTYVDEQYINISKAILKNLNQTFINTNIDDFRVNEFWSLSWLSKIIEGVENFLFNASLLTETFGFIDWIGLGNGQVNSTIDFILQLTNQNFLKKIATHLDGMLTPIEPLFEKFELGIDLRQMITGLESVRNISQDLLTDLDLKFEIKYIFRDWEDIKTKIANITMIDMELVNEIPEATIDIKPLLENESIQIGDHVCESHLFSKIFILGNFRSTESKSNQIIQKLSTEICNINNEKAKQLLIIFSDHMNFTTVVNMAINFTTSQIMKTSGLTKNQGAQVMNNIGKVVGLMPLFRELIENVTSIAKNEPLLAAFQNTTSVSRLLSKPDFLPDVGKMLCGKPFQTKISRFYRVIAEFKDNIIKPDKKQLQSLPSDYCKSFYKEVLNMAGGKILWTYVKPLLMGKILYTPHNIKTANIIKYANSTFMQIGRLTTLIKEFSTVFPSLHSIIDHKESLITMQNVMNSSSIRNLIAKMTNANISLNIDVSKILNEFSNSDNIESLVAKVSNMVGCINLNRFIPVHNEEQLQKNATALMEVNEFMAAIVFLNTNDSKETFEYKIRMDIDNVPSTSQIKHRFWMPGPNANFIENLRYFRGFVQLQDIIDKSIMSYVNTTYSTHEIRKRASENELKLIPINPNIYTQQMPYPCHTKDEFKEIVYESQALVIAFFFSLMLIVASIVRHFVWERESGNTSLMCVMGMNQNLHTYSWFISSLLEMLICMLALCIILKVGNILPNSNPLIILIGLFNYGLSVVLFGYMVTAMFRSASLGAVSAVIFYLICFLPYVIVIAMEAFLSFPEKVLTSLFMSSGFCYSILLTARYEVQGIGLHWFNINKSPLLNDEITVVDTFIIVLFDSLLYGVIGWIINAKRFKQTLHLEDIKSDSGLNETNVGVRVENITKIYKNRKRERKALDNVSIDFIKGHITTLLGHNGAGKTTLIKILMGITKPSSGKIVINKITESNRQSVDSKNVLKNHIGLCPQSDVLIETLTSKEHLSYYAQLKTGKNKYQVKDEVDSMIEIMGLGRLAIEPVHRLSGGLRRRLSVGLAFISNPHLVVLDEPSSGVDPVARRDIWSLIVSLKSDRTILLTTHHLDEAELLSDTLVIMHKGKVLTSCSPLELKNKYGDGYKLNVNYDVSINRVFSQSANEFSKPTITELEVSMDDNNIQGDKIYNEMNKTAKDFLNVIKETSSNANINSITEKNIMINLPYLDDMGQNNSFGATVKRIEDMKPLLKYKNFTVDSTSLEQVFLKICETAEEGNKVNREKTFDTNIKIVDQGSSSSSINSQITSINEDIETYEESNHLAKKEHNSSKLKGDFTQQLTALLLKRFLHYKRNYRLLIITLVLPAVFVALAMGFSLIRPPSDSENPMKLSPELYNKFSAEFASLPSKNHSENRNLYSVVSDMINYSVMNNNRTLQYITQSGRTCKCEDGHQTCKDDLSINANDSIPPQNQLLILPTMQKINQWIVETEDFYTEKRYGGWSELNPEKASTQDANNTNFIVWYNNKGDHALPSYLSALNNAVLKHNSNKNISIITYNHPLKLSVEQLSKSTLLQHVADVGIAVVLLIGFSLVPAGGAIYLVKERTSQEKRLQLLCGVSPFTYWLSTLIWDVLIIILAMVLSVIVIEIFGLPVFTMRENLPGICLLLLLYGISCSALIQILEKIFNDASLANMIIFCFNVFIGVTGMTILLIIDVLSKSTEVDNIRWYLHKIFMIFPQFTLGDGLVEISKNSIQASVLSRFGMDTYLSPLGWSLMGYHHFAFFATAIIFFCINLAYEYHYLDDIFSFWQKNEQSTLDPDLEDCDVATERYRVELATMKAHLNAGMEINEGDIKSQPKLVHHDKSDIMQVISLRKIYKNVLGGRVAVENLTFGIKPGQCFGLLGVNGAGKSTTFKILTGEILPTNGQLFINGKLATQKDLCNGSISYCPQVDALDPLITLYEHLDFYTRLRGLENKTKYIKQALREFDLLKYTHQKSMTLSGGNKRKLCTAISLMGNSSIVLMDEPTSGMDPGARHYVGLAIKRAIRNERCVLLSSHSLIECEDLCQISAVTSLGRFIALGTPDYLKRKYGGGYLISIRLKSPVQKGQLIQSICETFPNTLVQSSHYCTTQFLVPIQIENKLNEHDNMSDLKSKSRYVDTKLSDIFLGINNISNELNVADYSINQSSLDQVFINFSQNSSHSQTKKRRDSSGPIRLTTLERQYSSNQIIDESANGPNIIMTQF